MAVSVETLDKLERKIVLNLPRADIQAEVQSRIKQLARSVKMDGFRPGKVPAHLVSRRYGESVQHEVLTDKVNQAFRQAATEAELRVIGSPRITEMQDTAEGQAAFEAVFEIYPEVKIADLETAEIEKVRAEVSEAAIDKTLDILRKRNRTYSESVDDAQVKDGDRVTLDFEGKIDGETFAGGKAQGFRYIVGEGQMLQEFETAVRGMKLGESKTFQLVFPAGYHDQAVAGKTADFQVTVKKIEIAQLPEINDELAKSVGVADGTVAGLQADIRKNLERVLKSRLAERHRQAAMDVLVAKSELELPKSAVQAEINRMIELARADLKQRGVKDADQAPIPAELFTAQAERRVRLGLVIAELVRTHELQAKPEQLVARVDEMVASYEQPQAVKRWYLDDEQRMNEVAAMVIESNVTEFVFSKAKVSEKLISFDELMEQS